MQILIKAPKVSKEVTVEYDIPEALDDKIAKFGEAAVSSSSGRMIKTDIRNAGAALLEKGKTPEEVQAHFAAWLPGAPAVGGTKTKKPKVEKLIESISLLTPEQLAMVAEILAKKQATAG